MSTIEEVREQARKLDEPLRRAGNRAAWYQTGELELIEAARKSLRALLDATEPPAQADKPAEDEREALKYLCRRHAACRSTGWPPYFEHSVGCADWNSGRVAEGARR